MLQIPPKIIADVSFAQFQNSTVCPPPTQSVNQTFLTLKGILAQGSRKSKIGWELTKNGCHVRSPWLSKQPYICSFQTNYPYYHGFYASFLAFRPIWLAFSLPCSSFWLVDTYFWSHFSWLAKSGCKNLKLAGNMFPLFPPLWSPVLGHVKFLKTLKKKT